MCSRPERKKKSRRFQREKDRPADRELRNNEAMIKRSDFRETNNNRFISGFLSVTELRQICLNFPSYKVIFYTSEVKLINSLVFILVSRPTYPDLYILLYVICHHCCLVILLKYEMKICLSFSHPD